jgi:putative aminopeptidase FrvX
MVDFLPFLKELLSAPGLAGFETPVSDIIKKEWTPLVDEISISRVGSLHGFRRGTSTEPRPSLLLATHMDAIGLMVKGIHKGFLRITSIGGVDPRVLPGQQVWVHGSGSKADPSSPLPGWVVQPSDPLLPEELSNNAVPIENLFIDTGLAPEQVQKLINIGDVVSFAQLPVELNGETVAGHSLDNRAALAALTICLHELQHLKHAWDIWAVATVQEEEGLVGAYTSAFQLRPSLAVVIDTTWAKGPGADDWDTFPLAKGPTLMWGPNIHPKLHKVFKDLAEKLEIPHAVEVTGRSSGTDAYATQIVAEGIPSIAIGIPLRYMHTPVEMVSLKDIHRTGRLLAEFILSLSDDFMSKISLDS